MASTLSTTNLTVTITEQLTSNGQVLNYINQQVVPNIKPFDPRVMQIPTTEVDIINFSDAVSAGTFITEDLRYLRITNKDDTNWIRVRLKRNVTGIVTQIDNLVTGSGYTNGTYNNIPVIGGTGEGATINVTVAGTVIKTLGTITGGTLYTTGTYTTVALTGGTGSGAQATIVVAGGAVTSVTVTNGGTGYVVGDTLSALAADIGGTGSGFAVPVSVLSGGVGFTLVEGGSGYTLNDLLYVNNASIGNGTGFSFNVDTIGSETAIFDKRINAECSFIIDNTLFNVSDTNSSFSSFVDLQSISAQANTAEVDIEYFVASIV